MFLYPLWPLRFRDVEVQLTVVKALFGRIKMVNCMYSETVQPFRNKAEQKDLTDMNTNVMQLLEVREECASVTTALEAQKEVVV